MDGGRLIRSLSLLQSSLGVATLLALVATATAYWFRNPIADAYFSAKDGVIDALGLGIVPAVLWTATLAWAAARRRPWLRYYNLWLGSAALVVLALGTMAFFQPYKGLVSVFTLDGDVSLGGEVGQAILGPTTWLGALRLVGVAVAGLAVTSPPLALDLAARLGGLAVRAYIFLAVILQSIPHAFGFRRRGATAETRVGAYDDTHRSVRPPEVLTPYGRVRTLPEFIAAAVTKKPVGGPEAPGFVGSTTTSSPPSATPQAESAGPTTDEVQAEVVGRDVADEAPWLEPGRASGDAERPYLPEAAKFNRFWSPHSSHGDAEIETPERPVEQGAEPEAATEEVEWETEPPPLERPQADQWARPSTRLLAEAPEGGVTEEETQQTAETIRRTLEDYGVEVGIGQIRPGPTVTMYGLIPGWVRRYKQTKELDEEGRPRLDASGKSLMTKEETRTRVKVDTILSREKDLALALKTPSIRIETPVMGKSQVGIEVPNPKPSLVTLRSVMESEEFTRLRAKAQLPIALGKASGGETVVTDLAKMPHLLIAGATGSGKSACINAIISCLIMEKTPAEMRLLLVDPKRVELTPYNGIPHLLTPVVVETDRVVALLKGLIREMLSRYRRMEEVSVRNIEGYNRKMPDRMPFIVVAVDELADLMMSASFDVEQTLCRLAQLGRATGIHLVVATQRPSVDVVTGLIKANFPSRISFAVTSQVDSRTILDTGGADKLLGRGDMLYLPLDASRPVRAQGVFISDREIGELVRFWQTTPWAPISRVDLRTVEKDLGGDEDEEMDWDSRDEMLDKAIELAHSYKKLSTSLLQRRLRIGYPRAARLMDQLEEQGIVGPGDGSKSRDVIINDI